MIIGTSNQLKGIVVFIYEGAVNGTVGIELKSGEIVTSSMTMGSIEKLGIKVGSEAYCCFKATDVIVASEG